MQQMDVWKDQHVLVTGGAGFLGSHVTEQLVRAGAAVAVLDNLSTGSLANLVTVRERISLHKADVTQIDWREFLSTSAYQVIFHLAANAYVPPSVERPAWDYEINLASTFRLLDALRYMEWRGALIYASSAAVYGDPAKVPIVETDVTVPISPYGVGKLAAERYISVYSQLYGLRAASLRLFSIYGPRQRKQVVYDLINKIESDPQELFIHGDGTQVRDFNYVCDAASAAVLLATSGSLCGEVYNTASGQEHTIADLVARLCVLMDASPRLAYSGAVRPGDPERWSVNISRLANLGYTPQTSFGQGLADTVSWYRSACRNQ